MRELQVEEIKTVKYNDGPVPGKLRSVQVLFKSGESQEFAGDELAWVIPQIKDTFPSTRPNLLSDADV